MLSFYPLCNTSPAFFENPRNQILFPDHEVKYVRNLSEHISHLSDGGRRNAFDSNLEEKLLRSSEYDASIYLPAALEGSILQRYQCEYANPHQRQPDSEDLDVICRAAEEVSRYGKPLASGQIIFHGGDWPTDDSNGCFLTTLKTERVLSTTLMVGVACVHAGYHHPNMHVWVITVAAESQTKAIVYPPSGFLMHEFEVLLGAGATLQFDQSIRLPELTIIKATLR